MVPAVRLGLALSAEPSVDHSTKPVPSTRLRTKPELDEGLRIKPATEGSRRSAVASLITEGEVYMMSGTKPSKVSVSSLRSIVMRGLGRWRPTGT